MKVYFIQEHLDRRVFHGGIGNVDAERIFLQEGFVPILFPANLSFSPTAKLARLRYLINMLFALPARSVVILQFPLYAGMHRLFIRLLTLRKSIRIICFVLDIDGLKDGNQKLLHQEIRAFRRYRYFILHNEAMLRWLLSKTNPAAVTCIDFFDFLAEPVRKKRSSTFNIVFAGNLEKSAFLQALGKLEVNSPALIFNIYGKDPPNALLKQSNVRYMGFAEPYRLPGLIEGSFGLIWEGDSIDGATGSLGNYMVYITHHKLSLYILSGLPVIVFSGSACAALVKKYKIGIAVNSLYQAEQAIKLVSADAYLEMVNNTQKLAPAISGGEMLRKALEVLLKE